jgi:hypothetical protein
MIERGRIHFCYEREEATESLVTSRAQGPIKGLTYWRTRDGSGFNADTLVITDPFVALVDEVTNFTQPYPTGLLNENAADTVVYRGVLFVFEEGRPAKAFVNTRGNYQAGANSAGTTPPNLNTWAENVEGYPIYISRAYVQGNLNSFDLGGDYGSTSDRNFNGEMQPIFNRGGGHGAFMYFSNAATFDPNDMQDRLADPFETEVNSLPSFGGYTPDDDTFVFGSVGGESAGRMQGPLPFRAPYPHIWWHLRLPFVYKGRLAAFGGDIEVRQDLVDDDLINFERNSGDPLTLCYLRPAATGNIQSDIQDHFEVGEIIEIQFAFDAGNPGFGGIYDSEIFDPPGFGSDPSVTFRVQIFDIGDNTIDRASCFVIGTPPPQFSGDFDILGTRFWRIKPNTDFRNTLYWFGSTPITLDDPGAIPNNFDWMSIDEGTAVNYNLAENGPVVAPIVLEDAVLVMFEDSIRAITGTPPTGDNFPPSFRPNELISDSIGLVSKNAFSVDDETQTVYFCALDGIYRFYGRSIERIDENIRYHEDYQGPFDTVSRSDKFLYFSNSSTDVIWIYDLVSQSWTRTVGDHDGGVFNPLDRVPGFIDKVFVSSGDSIRTLNDPENIPARTGEAGVVAEHGSLLIPGYIDADTPNSKIVQKVHVQTSKENPAEVSKDISVTAEDSEGIQTFIRQIDPIKETQKDSEEIRKYRANGSGGRGADSVAITVGDANKTIGSIDQVWVDLKIANKGRP